MRLWAEQLLSKFGHHLLLFYNSTVLTRKNTLFSKKFLKKQHRIMLHRKHEKCGEVLAAPVGKCSMPNRDQGALVLCWAVLVCNPFESLCPRKGCRFPESRVLVLGELWGKGTYCFCPGCREVPCLCARAFNEFQTTDPRTVNSSSKGCRVQSILP